MKAISILHPWANSLSQGLSEIWAVKLHTDYRGDIVVCSGKELDLSTCVSTKETDSWLYGYALFVAELYECRPMDPSGDDNILAGCFYERFRYSWMFRNIRHIKPFPVNPTANIFSVDDKKIKHVCLGEK